METATLESTFVFKFKLYIYITPYVCAAIISELKVKWDVGTFESYKFPDVNGIYPIFIK